MGDALTSFMVPHTVREIIIKMAVPQWIPQHFARAIPRKEYYLGQALGIRVYTAHAATIDPRVLEKFTVVRIERAELHPGGNKRRSIETELTFTLASNKREKRALHTATPEMAELFKMLIAHTYTSGTLYDCGEKMNIILLRPRKALQLKASFGLS